MAVERMARGATVALKFFTKDADGNYGDVQMKQFPKMRALDVTRCCEEAQKIMTKAYEDVLSFPTLAKAELQVEEAAAPKPPAVSNAKVDGIDVKATTALPPAATRRRAPGRKRKSNAVPFVTKGPPESRHCYRCPSIKYFANAFIFFWIDLGNSVEG